MSDAFHQSPILNSPYEVPARHWVLDEGRQPTDTIGQGRRKVSFISPIPNERKQGAQQSQLALDAASEALETREQQYQLIALIDSLRQELANWRALPEARWRVTPETARLLKHWRHHQFTDFRPFFCQVEAVETIIWLTEVAPILGKGGSRFLEEIQAASQQANPGLSRMALKLATGAGKTAVMAMLIAWQTVNAARRPNSPRFTKGFLVVAPGITIRDRLRVLLVSGEPHAGGRTWRNLLKSDSAVDLVHFTILRPPEKQDGVPVDEQSLIAFPTRELVLEKIDDFDLIMFDRYKRRGILPSLYLRNVVE